MTWREELEERGFVVLRNFWTPSVLQEWQDAVFDVYRMQARKCGENGIQHIDGALHWLEANDKRAGYEALTILELSVAARKLLTAPELVEVTDALFPGRQTFSVGPHPFVNMPSSKRLLYRWHSESCYYPKRRRFYNFWMPIFYPKGPENGTMWMAAGSHKACDEWHFVEYQGYDKETYGKREHFVQYEIPISFLTAYEKVPIEADPGDVVVFDRLLAHASSQNHSGQPSLASVFRVFDYADDMTLAGDPAVKPFSGRDHGRPGMVVG